MHMHNAWLLAKSILTIELLSDYFTMPKYLFMFCGTLTLNDICDNIDANTFDFHTFLFTTSYIMIQDSFMIQMLWGSGSVSFCLNSTILLCMRYCTLSLIFLVLKLGLNHVLNFIIMTLFVLSKIFCIMCSDAAFSISNITIAIPGTFL